VYQQKKESFQNLFSNIAMETATKSSYYRSLKADFFLKLKTLKTLWMSQNKDNIKYH
jgi:hypothetical protein